MPRFLHFACSLLLVAMVAAVPALAADATGTISGSVTDPTGGAISGAKVTATSLTTNLTRSAVTAPDGGSVFPLMPVGPVAVSVEAPGFRRFEQRGVDAVRTRPRRCPSSCKSARYRTP